MFHMARTSDSILRLLSIMMVVQTGWTSCQPRKATPESIPEEPHYQDPTQWYGKNSRSQLDA